MAEETNKTKPDYQISEEEFNEGAQRHHDYYVRLSREAPLDKEDQQNLDAALKLEAEGKVKPLKEQSKFVGPHGQRIN